MDLGWDDLGAVADLPDEPVLPIRAHGRDLVLGRDGDAWFATQRRCPHHGADLAGGWVEDGRLVCPQHLWRFCTRTGELDGGAAVALDVYPVRVDDGRVRIGPRACYNPPP